MSWVKHGVVGLVIAGAVLGAMAAFEGREYPHTFRLIGVIALVTCTLSALAMVPPGWARLPLAGAFALSGLVAWDALLGDRRDDDPMTSPLFGYLLFDVLTVVLAIAALGTAALGRRR